MELYADLNPGTAARLAAALALTTLLTAASAYHQRQEDNAVAATPLHWELARQGDQALASIHQERMRQLRHLQPPVLETLQVEDWALAAGENPSAVR